MIRSTGGPNDDVLYGNTQSQQSSAYNDTYLIRPNGGIDTIVDLSNQAIVAFDRIEYGDLTFSDDGQSLSIDVAPTATSPAANGVRIPGYASISIDYPGGLARVIQSDGGTVIVSDDSSFTQPDLFTGSSFGRYEWDKLRPSLAGVFQSLTSGSTVTLTGFANIAPNLFK